MNNTADPRLVNMHSYIQLERKKLWVLDKNTKHWKEYKNKSQGLNTMQFDQTEKGNRGFDLPKNSLP